MNSTAPYPPLGENIPTSLLTYQIDDSITTEEEVKRAVWRLRGHRSLGPYRMRDEHLWEWLQENQTSEAAAEAKSEGETSDPEGRERETKDRMEDRGEERELTKWEMVVELVQLTLQDGVIVEEADWQAVILIPKERENYRNIGLVEVI